MKQDISRNINNMLSLWHLYDARKYENLWHSKSWPHRVWHDSLQSSQTVTALGESALTKEQRIVMIKDHNKLPSTWQLYYNSDVNLQLMELDLTTSSFSSCKKTKLISVHSESTTEINEFSALCSKGFGYEIDTRVLEKVARLKSIELMLLQIDGKSVATALVHTNERVFGIYQIAVPAEHRGKGYATSIMLHLLNHAQQNGFQHACLQASEMGQNLYLKFGFKICGQLEIYQPK